MFAAIFMALWLALVVTLATLGVSFLFGWASLAKIGRGVTWLLGPGAGRSLMGR